jgi:proteic killer suppression protein
LSRFVTARAKLCAAVFSIRVNNQWRICFTWSSSGAGNVALVDYH